MPTTCLTCSTEIHPARHAITGEPEWHDSDRMGSSESPVFHDHEPDFDVTDVNVDTDPDEIVEEPEVPVMGTPEADVVLERIASENRERRGYGPAGMQSQEGAERAQAEYEAAQARLAEQVAVCPYCKGAKTRAANKVAKARAGAVPSYYRSHPQDYIDALERKVEGAMCKSHRERSRLNYVCSPVSETYWCS